LTVFLGHILYKGLPVLSWSFIFGQSSDITVGGGVGAAGGAVIGAVTGGSAIYGGLLGGAAGAAVGALSTPSGRHER